MHLLPGKRAAVVFLAVAAVMLLPLAAATATTFDFFGITSNKVGDVAIGEAQLSMEVESPETGLVSFTFKNAVGEASSITDVHFYDGVYIVKSYTSPAIDEPTGVSFAVNANPPLLPGYRGPLTVYFSGDSNSGNPGVEANGVNTSAEYVTFTYTLHTGVDLAEIINALNTGKLVVGLHVQGFASGGSESFANVDYKGDMPAPVPASALLLGPGLLGLGLIGWRRREKKA